MTNHGATVGAIISPVVAGAILSAGREPRGERSAMRIGSGKHIVLVVGSLRADPAIHELAILGQRRSTVE